MTLFVLGSRAVTSQVPTKYWSSFGTVGSALAVCCDVAVGSRRPAWTCAVGTAQPVIRSRHEKAERSAVTADAPAGADLPAWIDPADRCLRITANWGSIPCAGRVRTSSAFSLPALGAPRTPCSSQLHPQEHGRILTALARRPRIDERLILDRGHRCRIAEQRAGEQHGNRGPPRGGVRPDAKKPGRDR